MGIPVWINFTADGRHETAWSHVGLVLEDRERNGYDDSVFYAVVWNAEKGEPEQITYGSTRGPSPRSCVVDATPHVREAYDAYLIRRRVAQEERVLRFGKSVLIVAGKNKGLTGKITWRGLNKFAPRGVSDPLGFGATALHRYCVQVDGVGSVFASGDQLELREGE